MRGLHTRAVVASKRVHDLGFLFVVPVVISALLMLGVALLNNLFADVTKLRKYPAGGYDKLYRW